MLAGVVATASSLSTRGNSALVHGAERFRTADQRDIKLGGCSAGMDHLLAHLSFLHLYAWTPCYAAAESMLQGRYERMMDPRGTTLGLYVAFERGGAGDYLAGVTEQGFFARRA